jgi:hypothetical protein
MGRFRLDLARSLASSQHIATEKGFLAMGFFDDIKAKIFGAPKPEAAPTTTASLNPTPTVASASGAAPKPAATPTAQAAPAAPTSAGSAPAAAPAAPVDVAAMQQSRHRVRR